MFLNDKQIIELCEQPTPMIAPFFKQQIRRRTPSAEWSHLESYKVISYGVSSVGYDVTLAATVKKLKPGIPIIDPKNLTDDDYITLPLKTHPSTGATYVIVPPRGFVLAHTIEYFEMPSNVTGLYFNKSTLVRAATFQPATVWEPGWRGTATLEIQNVEDAPLRLYVNEGIGQVLFWQTDSRPETTYEDKAGKYQGQTGITPARI